MVFEKLKATFSEHLTHTSFISRKVGFSRRCPDAPLRGACLLRRDDLLDFPTDLGGGFR